MLQIGIYHPQGHSLLLDLSRRIRSVEFSTGEHGFEALTGFVPMPLADQFWLYDRPALHRMEAGAWGLRAWEGRLEDIQLSGDGLRLGAFGYQRALGDGPYTALWSTTGVADFRPFLDGAAFGVTASPERYTMDTNNRLFIGLNKGAIYGDVDHLGGYVYTAPDGGSRPIVAVSFDYEVLLPVDWSVSVYTLEGFQVWLLTADGTLQSGTVTLTSFVGDPTDDLVFMIFNATGGDYTATEENGAEYARFTALRIQSTTSAEIYADEIARDLAATANALNPTQMQTASALIASPGLDLRDEIYLDTAPADILTRLARLGDDQTPPRQWEWGVWEDRVLHFRPRGSAGRRWTIDLAAPQIEKTIETLRNSVYGVYQEADGRTLRTGVNTDDVSVARHGLTRRAAVTAQTTSEAQAETQRDAFLDDHTDPIPRSGIDIYRLIDAAGNVWPKWACRSGDAVTIRNVPVALGTDIDRILTFRVSTTRYAVDVDRLAVTPELPLPGLEMLLARREEGI